MLINPNNYEGKEKESSYQEKKKTQLIISFNYNEFQGCSNFIERLSLKVKSRPDTFITWIYLR